MILLVLIAAVVLPVWAATHGHGYRGLYAAGTALWSAAGSGVFLITMHAFAPVAVTATEEEIAGNLFLRANGVPMVATCMAAAFGSLVGAIAYRPPKTVRT